MANDVLAPMPQPQLIRRLLFTAGVLILYRLGCQISLPGLNTDVLAGLGGVLKTETISIFALGVTPFFSVLFVFELLKLIVPPLSRWEASDRRNAQRLGFIIYLAALAAAGVQARGLANAFFGINGLVDGPGWENLIAITLVAGTALLCWLGERITVHGLGNGFWLLLITPTLATGVSVAAGSYELMRTGAIQPNAILAALAFVAVATALIVMTSKAGVASVEHRVSGADFVTVWPPLLAAYVNGFKVTISGVEISLAAQLALLAATIALFNGLQWLGSAPATQRPIWAVALVQIFICVGAELLTHTLQLPFPISGAWLIVIVMTTMSCVRALGPLPEALRAKPA